jgi:hypothetical protein
MMDFWSGPPETILRICRERGYAKDLVKYLEGTFYELVQDVTGLTIDREQFTARCLRAWPRNSIGMATIDWVPLAAIVEAASHSTFSYEELKRLRTRLAFMNQKYLEILADKSGREYGKDENGG